MSIRGAWTPKLVAPVDMLFRLLSVIADSFTVMGVSLSRISGKRFSDTLPESIYNENSKKKRKGKSNWKLSFRESDTSAQLYNLTEPCT